MILLICVLILILILARSDSCADSHFFFSDSCDFLYFCPDSYSDSSGSHSFF